jgi:hypothetical protein
MIWFALSHVLPYCQFIVIRIIAAITVIGVVVVRVYVVVLYALLLVCAYVQRPLRQLQFV